MLQLAIDAVAHFQDHKLVAAKQQLVCIVRERGRRGGLKDFPSLESAVVAAHQASKRALKMFQLQEEHWQRNAQSGANCEPPDHRFLRFSLVMEEAAVELATALIDGDEEKLLDAMADAVYVIAGTAVTFDLPLSAAFEEVHRSNMTKKAARDNDQQTNRLSDKGDEYQPPRLKELLLSYRANSGLKTKLSELL